MAIFFNFSTTSNHLHPLQVENCDSNSRLVVDEDDNSKLRLERVEHQDLQMFGIKISLLNPLRKIQWKGSLCDREVECSTSDHKGCEE